MFAAYQAYAWWHDARIVAGAPNTIRFYAHAVWTPPGGWLPWVASAVVGTYVLLAYASTEAFPGRRLRTTRRSAGHERAVVVLAAVDATMRQHGPGCARPGRVDDDQ